MEEMEGTLGNQMGSDSNPFGGSSTSDNSSEPLLVGSNITFKLDPSTEGNSSSSDTESSEPIAVGTNLTVDLTGMSAEEIEQLGISQDGSNDYLGTNISSSGDGSDWMERVDNNPLAGGGDQTTGADNAPQNDENYNWDVSGQFGGMTPGDSMGGMSPGGGGETTEDPLTGGGMPSAGDNNAPSNDGDYKWDINAQDEMSSGGSDLDALFEASPWGGLSEVGVDSFEQVFPNADVGSSPLAGGSGSPSGGDGGDPFAGGGIPSFGGADTSAGGFGGEAMM